MPERDGNGDPRGVIILVLGVAAMAALTFALVWSALSDSSGCGPSGLSSSAQAFDYAPFVLLVVAAGVISLCGWALGWRGRVIVAAAIAVVVVTAIGEFAVFWYQFAVHHCGD